MGTNRQFELLRREAQAHQSCRRQGPSLQRRRDCRKNSVCGRTGSVEEGKLAAGGIAAETKAALENIQKVLKTAGFEMSDIVSVTVYLADIQEFGDMNKVYKETMPDPKPARATIQAAALVNHARIEVSVIAVKQ
jgi:2-iminobutanoate/2-iminopropanoate deaminase